MAFGEEQIELEDLINKQLKKHSRSGSQDTFTRSVLTACTQHYNSERQSIEVKKSVASDIPRIQLTDKPLLI
jgi:hypothetical protein